jgi:hypothetical protein
MVMGARQAVDVLRLQRLEYAMTRLAFAADLSDSLGEEIRDVLDGKQDEEVQAFTAIRENARQRISTLK